MRLLLCLLAVVAWPVPGSADPGPVKSKFWERVARPHEQEILDVLRHARQLYESADRPVRNAADVEFRQRLLADARGMLRYALGRVPERTDVIELLAYVEEASGHMDQALALYERYVEIQPHDLMSGELCLRHGLLLWRMGSMERAVKRLEPCVEAPARLRNSESRVHAIVHLANLYMDQGRVTAATELLRRHTVGEPSPEPLLVFALAVAYDKDEQLSLAYETLAALQIQGQRDVTIRLLRSLEDLSWFVPAEDRAYFLALLYEVSGYLAEAREEWHNYTRSGELARYARRARTHMEAIEGLLDKARASQASGGVQGGTPAAPQVSPPVVP